MSVVESLEENSGIKRTNNNLFNVNQNLHDSDKFDNRSGFFQIAASPNLRKNR